MAIETFTVPNARFLMNAPFGRLFDWQLDWLSHFDRGLARFSILEIHRRARKTSTAINLLIRECDRNARSRYVYVGPTFAECRRIVWDDPDMLNLALPDKRVLSWKKNEQRMIVKFGNGSVFQCVGGDDPDNLRGIDFEGIAFDEWAQEKAECWTEVLQPVFRQSVKRWVAFLYTPKGNNHATQMFDRAACIDEGYSLPISGRAQKCRKNWYASRLLASQSGIIPASELAAAKEETPESFYEQEYECARITSEEMTLITSTMLDSLPREAVVYPTTKRLISCDPSMGGDACVIHAFQGSHVLRKQVLHTRDTMRIVGELVLMGRQKHTSSYVIDSIGIGRGICDRLNEISREGEKKYVIEFCSSEAASNPGFFANRRAEMWWKVMLACRRTDIEYPHDPETRRQIPYASRYKIPRGRVQIQDKQIIKVDLGRSPDDAESWAMGIAHLDEAQTPQELAELVQSTKEQEPVDPMDWI